MLCGTLKMWYNPIVKISLLKGMKPCDTCTSLREHPVLAKAPTLRMSLSDISWGVSSLEMTTATDSATHTMMKPTTSLHTSKKMGLL